MGNVHLSQGARGRAPAGRWDPCCLRPRDALEPNPDRLRRDDDAKDTLTAWLPKNDVRPGTNPEWDIDQYNRCPESLRAIR